MSVRSIMHLWVVVGVITFPTSYFIILSVINAQQVDNGKKVVIFEY